MRTDYNCFVCDKPILDTEKVRIIPFDKPYYANVYIHYSCWKAHYDDYPNFILANENKVLDIAKSIARPNEEAKKNKKDKKKRKLS